MTPPANNLTLSNTTLSDTYEAQNLITVETNVTVSGTAILKAGNTIDLKPSFSLSSGCNLTISVGSVTSDKYYYLKDHLGSTRVEFDRNASISSAYGYYAYGQISQSYNNSNPNDKYKFTGKERDTETNYGYFGARYYDSDLGRWLQVDPLADKYPGWSPYNYTMNNPLRFIDPNGMETGDPDEDEKEKERKENERQKALMEQISQIGETVERGVEMIVSGVTSALSNAMGSLYNTIYKDGPTYLNNRSSEIFLGGTIVGAAVSTVAPEVGVPLIGFSAATGSVLDGTATVLTAIDLINGGNERINNFVYQSTNFSFGYLSGKMTPAMGSKLNEMTRSIDWSVFQHIYVPKFSGF